MVCILKRLFDIKVYLGIPPNPFNEYKEVLILQEPLNTTGDFYHVLAYIALAEYFGYDIPELRLTYQETNKKETELTYLRNLALLELLGKSALVTNTHGSNLGQLACSQSKARRFAARVGLREGNVHFIDQKAVTLILAHLFISYRSLDVSFIIRSFLQNFSRDLAEDVINLIGNFEKKIIDEIRVSEKPYVVFHLRYAAARTSGHNVQHDLDDERFVLPLAQFLAEKGHGILFVHSSSRKNLRTKYDVEGSKVVRPFDKNNQPERSQFGSFFPESLQKLVEFDGDGEVKESSPVDIGKLLHIHFFVRLYDLVRSGRDIKVIGNTSGTTDCVALMGHNVFNIHKFSEEIDSFDYKDYRILMQLTFMSVIEKEVAQDLGNLQYPILDWLQRECSIRPSSHKLKRGSVNALLCPEDSYKIDMAMLNCILGWPHNRARNTDAKDDLSAEPLPYAESVFNWLRDSCFRIESQGESGQFESEGEQKMEPKQRALDHDDDDPVDVWDINVPGDGNCLFYSFIIGALLPCCEEDQDDDQDDDFHNLCVRLFGEITPEEINSLREDFQSYNGETNWPSDHLCDYVLLLRNKVAERFKAEDDQVFVQRVVDTFNSAHNGFNFNRQEIATHISQNKSWSSTAEEMLLARYVGVRVVDYMFTGADSPLSREFDSVAHPGVHLNEVGASVIIYHTSDAPGSDPNHFHCFIPQREVPQFSARVASSRGVNEVAEVTEELNNLSIQG